MRGLGRSYFAQMYGICNREETETYLNHEVLGKRLREITMALLEHDNYSAAEILGDLDAMKVRSCMTKLLPLIAAVIHQASDNRTFIQDIVVAMNVIPHDEFVEREVAQNSLLDNIQILQFHDT